MARWRWCDIRDWCYTRGVLQVGFPPLRNEIDSRYALIMMAATATRRERRNTLQEAIKTLRPNYHKPRNSNYFPNAGKWSPDCIDEADTRPTMGPLSSNRDYYGISGDVWMITSQQGETLWVWVDARLKAAVVSSSLRYVVSMGERRYEEISRWKIPQEYASF